MRNFASTLASLSELADGYDVIFCDVWGVIHDGARLYPRAREALLRFRQSGGSVILLSNASRLSAAVKPELERFGLGAADYDALLTSGDIARDFILQHPGMRVFDLGPGNASPIFENLDMRFTAMKDADIAVSAGAFQDEASVELLGPQLHAMHQRGLGLLCANPDVVTSIGGRRVKCSGAIAEVYSKMGGRVHYTGKPHPAIFEQGLAVASKLRANQVRRDRVIMIGDSVRTDVAGAHRNGFDSLFIASGIHAQQLDRHELLTPQALESFFSEFGITPSAVTWQLSW